MMTGDQVKAIRKSIGLGQIAFADRLGTSQRVVSKWENGHATPSPVYQRLIQAIVDGSNDAEYAPESRYRPSERRNGRK